jgi:hypothetical protein
MLGAAALFSRCVASLYALCCMVRLAMLCDVKDGERGILCDAKWCARHSVMLNGARGIL